MNKLIRWGLSKKLGRERFVVRCPRCGVEGNLRKKWKLRGKPDKYGEATELLIGLFDCSHCGGTYRAILSKQKIKVHKPKRL